MLEKVLNKIGLYTKRQFRELSYYVDAVEHRIDKYIKKCREIEEENEKFKLRIAKSKQSRRKGRK